MQWHSSVTALATESAILALRVRYSFYRHVTSICPNATPLGEIMSTKQLTKQSPTTTELSSLSVLDRLALHGGLVMIRWAERPHRTRMTFARHALDAVDRRRELVEAQYRAAGLR